MTMTPPDSSPRSTPAILSFYLLTIFMISVGALFWLVSQGIQIDPVMIGILGGIFTTEAGALTAITGFWLASSLNANRANEKNSAAIAQIAAAGGTPVVTPVVLDPDPSGAVPAPPVPAPDPTKDPTNA